MRPGDVLAHYRIEELLGAGGMGEVYRAHDDKLNRTVALKLLPQDSVSDPDRRRRFLQEAQTASALDHPNIVTIHDIVEADGQHFIVMQYVKGRTLRELIREGLEISMALDYAVQIAEGLSAAHAAGIVHRDLKPDNVIIDDTGRPKILDFGLAKLTEPLDVYEAETRDQVRLTKEGHIVGTAAYMSPEQAQGKKVDARSDIFSFGSVLYEMVTGKHAFEGDNVASVMAAIIKEDPLPVEPAGLDALLRRTLEKDPARRLSSMGEAKKELETIRSAPKARAAWRVPGWLGVAALLIVVALLLYALWPVPDSLPPPRVVPVTSDPGDKDYPVLSPDEGRVAFLMNGDVHVQNSSGGDALQLTDTSAEEVSAAWTPDGQRITFLRATETERAIFSISALGGAETKITNALGMEGDPTSGMSWSPDGKTLAYVDRDAPDDPIAVFLLDTVSGERTRLTNPSAQDLGDGDPIFSPDGQTIAFVRMTSQSWYSDIYLKDLNGGEEVRLTSDKREIFGLDWAADGRSIIYAADEGTTITLYRIPVSGGEPRTIEGVEGKAHRPSVSRTGSFLVYSQSTVDENIWRAPGPRSAGGEPKYLFGSTRGESSPQYSPDVTRIAFVSDRSGNWEVWLCDSDGENPVRLTRFGKFAGIPRWSPDGDTILLHARLEDHVDIYRISAAGGVPERFTTEPSNDGVPSLSRNGEWLYFNSDRSGSMQIWKMAAAGGKATQLTRNGGVQPVESFDGAFVYFMKVESGVWRVPSSGGPAEEEEIVLADVPPQGWALIEDGIAFVNEATHNFEFFDFASGEKTPFASAPKEAWQLRGLSLSPDGRWLLYPQNDAPGADIVMLENFR